MALKISHLHGREILDSRGLPALEVELTLNNKVTSCASVPSGASTGIYEALELRDQDPQRFHGKGLLKAISHIKSLSKELRNQPLKNQYEVDSFLKKSDGSSNKSHLGANTLLAVSLAYAKAKALSQNQELFESCEDIEHKDIEHKDIEHKDIEHKDIEHKDIEHKDIEHKDIEHIEDGNPKNYTLPVPLINILNGGAHANNGLSVQEFMIVPYGFESLKEALRASSEVFHCLRQILKQQNLSTAVGDEGGFAPQLPHNESALKLLLQAIEKAGYSSEKQIALALDVAASEFYHLGKGYKWEKDFLTAEDIISIYKNWCTHYPLISIEDGLAEEDWSGWIQLTKQLGKKIQLVGDDLFVTHVNRLQKGINGKVANSLLAKINQVGTLTETFSAIQLAQKAGYTRCISHRSGETEDTSIADLAVAWRTEQIKTGSVCRGERTAKYNRLLRIEEKLKSHAEFLGKKAFPSFFV